MTNLENRVKELEGKIYIMKARFRGLEQEWLAYEAVYKTFMTRSIRWKFWLINRYRWVMRKKRLNAKERLRIRMARVFYGNRVKSEELH